MKKLVLAIAVAATLVGCKTSPTGRTQLALYSEQQMDQMGVASFEQMKQEQKVYLSANTNRYVKCIANALIAQLPTHYANQQWEVVVFEDDSANAFALPGGKIGVHTGILNVAENQDQLAAVMGHEVGHVIAEHANERVSQSSILQLGLQAGAAVLEMNNVEYRNAILQGLGLGAQYGVALPFSRSHESEADVIGLDLMAKAGFNPEGSVALWQNMAKMSEQRPPEFMSTHPAPENRIKQLEANMVTAKATANKARASGFTPSCKR
ncbi:M48 family metallopeptidase [Pseudoalteromonas sp. McH1-7]|uniref:M48 family metallopeptidase n=1 Tax=Pseudoalteromonas TaxID=53246 RepID=UPI001590CB29|nr:MULTISPECIES: M48 family metallopeptidase [Pseudoalteromonas]MDW7548013.1 M48 family metallopeptidase [Pseudoalteromonas peptidolytica]NUZ10995.1 M48 family metallopeptidase [Pseudoalteromonas sp. McH1-7]USD27394.1 M48 family metallopeptidase [Pseudoalteromonas sp. SCSIO 43201]